MADRKYTRDWRIKTRDAAKALLKTLLVAKTDKEIKTILKKLKTQNLSTDLAMLAHHLNTLLDSPLSAQVPTDGPGKDDDEPYLG